ncbi:MAG: extracellular solute-binding protein [Fervidicoccaceae archaeon]
MGSNKAISTSLVISIVVVVLIIAVAGAYLAMRGGAPSTTTTPPATTTTIASTTTTPLKTTTTTTTTPPATTTTTTTTAQAQGVTLTILTRHSTDILDLARKMFLNSTIAKQYNIVDLNFIVVPPGLWPSTATAKSVDLGWGGGPTLFDTMYLSNLTAPLTLPIALNAASQIPDQIAGVPMKRVGPDGKLYWVAAAISSFGFTVNTQLAQQFGLPIPQKWEDLGSLAFGKVFASTGQAPLAIADPTSSTSNTRMYEIILQAFGWDQGWRLLTLMAANSYITASSEEVRDVVIRGERIVGITIDFYGYTAHYQNPACIYVIPANESIVNGDPIALFSTSKHPTEAQAFIAWVLSTEGQKVWLDNNINRLPSNPNVFNTTEGKARQDLYQAFLAAEQSPSINFSDNLALSYEYIMQNYFKATLTDEAQYLQNAWLALVKAYTSGKINQTRFQQLQNMLTDFVVFTNPLNNQKTTLTQDVAIKLNDAVQSNPSILDNLMSQWRTAAQQKYMAVLQALGG